MRRINKIHAWQVVEIEAIPLQGWSVLRRLFHPGTATKNSSTRPRRNVISLFYIYIYIYLDRTDASPRGYEGSVFILRLTRPLCPVFTRDGSKDPCGGEVPRGWITRLLSPVDSYRNLYTLPGQISHLVSPSSGIHYLDVERGDPGQIGLLLLELVC